MDRIDLGAMIVAQDKGAWLSECGTYRYALWRMWDRALPPLVVCMLNPSTADASIDDPTIRRVIGFAKRDGFGGILVVNLFAYRATDPAALLSCENRIGGPEGEAIHYATATMAARSATPVLIGWGALHPRFNPQWTIARYRSLGAHLVCLGTTKDGHPRHPLYIRADQPMVEFAG